MVRDIMSMKTLIQKAEEKVKNGEVPKNFIVFLANLGEEVMEERNNKRQPKLPAPEGGISIREASRKHKIPATTILGWINKGDVEILERLPNWTYARESDIIKKAKSYRPGRGRRKNNEN